MKYCCDNFQWSIQSIGKKGMAIIPTKIGEYNCFVIQSRSNDKTMSHDSNNIAQQTIRFCPWCGKKLADLIMEDMGGFILLETENKDFILPSP